MPVIIDMTGLRFGRLTVLSIADYKKGSHVKWLCKCDCGKTKSIGGPKLRSGNTKSCGCLNSEMAISRFTTHGGCKLAEYKIWKSIRQRCNDINYSDYNNYGGRGIKVCDRWNDFSNFIDDMGERPSNKYQIDRIDNNGDYRPDNCRWATQLEQANNKRNNVFISYNGLRKTVPQWSRYIGMKPATLYARIFTYNWSINESMTKGVK